MHRIMCSLTKNESLLFTDSLTCQNVLTKKQQKYPLLNKFDFDVFPCLAEKSLRRNQKKIQGWK